MNGYNDCWLINVEYVCKTFPNQKQLSMKLSIQSIQKKGNSTKKDYNPDHLPLIRSGIKDKSFDTDLSSKKVSYIVEWQMNNPQPEYSEEKW